MSKEIEISAIIACYNNSSDLIRCVDSLYNQGLKYDEFEVIIIDDGSTDDSGQIADNYMKTKSNLTVVHKENEGVGVSRNLGLSLAKGKYLHFIDGDDFVLCGSYRYVLDDLLKEDADIICFDYVRDAKEDSGITIGEYVIYKDVKQYLKHTYMPVTVWSKLFRRDFLINSSQRWLPISYGEDFSLIWHLFRLNPKTIISRSKIYSYSTTPDSLVHTKSIPRVKKTIEELIVANKVLADVYEYYHNCPSVIENFTHKYNYLFNRILCTPYSFREIVRLFRKCSEIGIKHVQQSREIKCYDILYHHPVLYYLFQRLILSIYFRRHAISPNSIDFIYKRLS